MKTYILLDNDGVTNAFGQMHYLKGKKSSSMSELNPDNWRSKVIEGYTIQYNTDVIDAINELTDKDEVELVVLSTWEHLSITHYYPDLEIKFPEGTKVLENVYENSTDYTLGWGGWHRVWWKLLAVRDFCETLEEDSRIVWVDDDHKFYEVSVSEYTENHPLVKFLVVSPEPTFGLSKKNLDVMRNFINEPENTGAERIV